MKCFKCGSNIFEDETAERKNSAKSCCSFGSATLSSIKAIRLLGNKVENS